VFIEWADNNFAIISPKDARTRLNISYTVVKLLAQFREWNSVQRVVDLMALGTTQKRELSDAVDLLVKYGILIPDTEKDDFGEQTWDRWGSIARLYHTSSRNAPYITNDSDRKRQIAKIAETDPPFLSKTYGSAKRIPLPERDPDLESGFDKVLFSRRTHRKFTSAPISLQDCGAILKRTFAAQNVIDAGPFGKVQLRTSPNAGARHEIECYVLPLNVTGLPCGVYHYNSQGHYLEKLAGPVNRDEIKKLLYEQPAADSLPVIFATTAVTSRITYKYRDVRAYRLWMYNIGHVGQTFALTATALGLGAFQTVAFHDSSLDRLLGLNGKDEFATYVLGCGHSAETQGSSYGSSIIAREGC
jgi:SagB-type dehydrogenase family enzyme